MDDPAADVASAGVCKGIVAGVLVFGGVGVFLLMGQDQPADEPEVATLPSAGDKSAGSTGQHPGATPGYDKGYTRVPGYEVMLYGASGKHSGPQYSIYMDMFWAPTSYHTTKTYEVEKNNILF